MWSKILDPGLNLLSLHRRDIAAFAQEITHFAVHHDPRTVLWCDGDHGFNPYDFAELNLTRGHEPGHGADRVLVKRCMTAFNWELALDRHVEEKLATTPTSVVIMAPYDALFCHPELTDWEQEDYVRFSLHYLQGVAKRHDVPLLAFVDMDRLWRTHPLLAQMILEGTHCHWSIDSASGHWRAEHAGQVIQAQARTLLDFEPLGGGFIDPMTGPKPLPV